MGQFLCIGLFTEFAINKEEIKKFNLTVEEVIHWAEQEEVFCKELYMRNDTDEYVLLTLDPVLVRQNLLPFLEDFYRMRYPSGSCDYESEAALSALSESDPNEWFAIANKKKFQSYQTDSYYTDYVKVNNSFRPLTIKGIPIILSMDGKIQMECYDGIFQFFTKCIQEQLKNHPLSKAIKVYISA